MTLFLMITKCFLLLSPTKGHAHKYTHTEKHTGDDDERMIASSCNTHFSAISIDTLFCVTFGPTNKNVIPGRRTITTSSSRQCTNSCTDSFGGPPQSKPPEDYVRRVLWSGLGGIVTLCYCNSFFSGWFNLADFGELQTPLSLTLGPRAVGV